MMKLSIKIPVNQQIGTGFPLLVEAQDDNGRTAVDYAGKVKFLLSQDLYADPSELSFTDDLPWLKVSIASWVNDSADYYEFYPVQRGRSWIGAFDQATETYKITVSEAGTYVILAIDEQGVCGRSNPFVVRDGTASPGLYFGDIHGHCGEHTCGIGTIDHYYLYAKHTAGLDFCALSDHDAFNEVHQQNLLSIWDKIKAAAEYWNRPGEFVTFLGYEWSSNSKLGGEGHKNVYFPGGDGPMFAADSAESFTLEKLCSCLKDTECLIIPHHPAAPEYWATNWNHHDPDRQRLVEICSMWGSSEIPDSPEKPFPIRQGTSVGPFVPGTSVIEALERGYHLGFIGGGDSHDCKPGESLAHVPLSERERRRWNRIYLNGLQGVWASELSREAIWDAMMKRRVYATTGKRIIVEFFLNDNPMGSIISEPNDKRHLRCEVVGTAPIKEIEIVKNGRVVHSTAKDKLFWCDDAPQRQEDYYYARITQEDTNMAWASPIWIKKEREEA